MKKKLMSVILCLCMLLPMLSMPILAAATNISVDSVTYYDNGDVESIKVKFGWNTASANSRMTVMTKRLRSAGEAGTNKTYGDFTNLGHYGKSFSSWDKVLEQSGTFGMLYYTDEQQIYDSKSNTMSLYFDKGDIPLNQNQTYYLYLWTYYQRHYYPDNLFMVLQVKDGTFSFAPATGRNSYGSFSPLWELTDKPSGGNNNSTTSGSVSLVRATVTEPKSGAAPDFTVLLPATASTTIKEVEWIGAFDDHGCFQDGESYTVKLTVGMDEGFEGKTFNINSAGVRVNGKQAKLESVSNDKKQIVMSYTFPKLKSTSYTVTNLDITFPTLTVGSTPPTASQTTVSNSSTYIKDVEWFSDYDGDTFVDNKDYTVYVTVAIKSGVNATFNLSKATIDGDTAKIENISGDNKEVVISTEYTSKIWAPATVSEVAVTVPSPVVGKAPSVASDITIANKTDTYVKDIVWVSDHDGSTFQSGKTYIAYVTVAIKDGVNKTFDLSKVTINGNTAAIDSISADQKQVVIAGAFLPAAAPAFTDVNGHWSSSFVNKVCGAGWMTGKGEGKFDPTGNLSLAEVMVLASRLHADQTKSEIPTVNGAWYMTYYSYCQNNGLLNGLSIAEKDLNRPATRYEMVAILDRAASKDKTSGGVNTVNNGFIPDVKESDTHGEVVYRWYRSGIVTGDSARKFNGNNNITRAEVSVILCQLLELVDRAKI